MTTSSQTATENNTKKQHHTGSLYSIILHNDDVNSFEYVAMTLVEVCDHDIIQAEQCTYITHFNGKCDIKTGSFSSLEPIKTKLISKGLSATIEET